MNLVKLLCVLSVLALFTGCPGTLTGDANSSGDKSDDIPGGSEYSKSIKGSKSLWFDDTVHHKIEIEIDKNIYNQMVKEHVNDSTEYRLVKSFTFNGVTMHNVAMKCRGGTTGSNENDGAIDNKKSYKIQFDTINPLNTSDPASSNKRASYPDYDGRKFYGEKEINLRTSPNDPSVIRELISYKMFRENGVPAPRASTATVYLNGVSCGVYLIVEEIDKRFLKDNFNDDKGNLYKCGWSSGGATFRTGSYNAGRYELRTNKTAGDTSDIKNFIIDLPKVTAKSDLEKMVNLDNIISYMAVSSMIGHWDGLLGNFNNDFVYNDPSAGRWNIVAWDCDNVFGSDWMRSFLQKYHKRTEFLQEATSNAIISHNGVLKIKYP
jgi:spore coat protein CotH